MATFIKIHDQFNQERIINLEQIVTVSSNSIMLTTAEIVDIPRENEWNKVMIFVNRNTVIL